MQGEEAPDHDPAHERVEHQQTDVERTALRTLRSSGGFVLAEADVELFACEAEAAGGL